MDARRLNVLLGHLDAYIQDIENFTVPTTGGVRRIEHIAAALALSESFSRLSVAYFEAQAAEFRPHLRWKQTGEGVRISEGIPYGPDGLSPRVMAPLSMIEQVLSWPADRAADPNEHRYRFRDEIAESDLAQIRRARSALGVLVSAPLQSDSELGPSSGSDCHITHSENFSWLRVGAVKYDFSSIRQRTVIEVLYAEWERAGGLDGSAVHNEIIRDRIRMSGDRLRIDKYFAGHPVLGTILRQAGRGLWALYLNTESDQRTREGP